MNDLNFRIATDVNAGYRVVGHRAGKPQPGGAPKSFTLMDKELPPRMGAVGIPRRHAIHE